MIRSSLESRQSLYHSVLSRDPVSLIHRNGPQLLDLSFRPEDFQRVDRRGLSEAEVEGDVGTGGVGGLDRELLHALPARKSDGHLRVQRRPSVAGGNGQNLDPMTGVRRFIVK